MLGMAWFGRVCCGMVWCGSLYFGRVRCGVVHFGIVDSVLLLVVEKCVTVAWC